MGVLWDIIDHTSVLLSLRLDICFVRYNIVHPAVDLPKCVLWDIVNFLMHPVRHVIEDDRSLDRVTVKGLGIVSRASPETPVSDSDLSLVSGIMFDQHDKLTERMDRVEESVGQYLRVHVASPLVPRVAV